jgi:hypothetical protein
MPGINLTASLRPFDCANCDDILSRRCIDCDRIYKARQATVDLVASDKTSKWTEADLYPPS